MFKPSGNNVLIKPKAQDTKTKAGIIVVENPNHSPTEGEIIAKGSFVLDNAIVVGRTAKFKKQTGEKLTVEGEEYLIMNEEFIYGTFEK